jgi:hypothetical protein
MNTSIRSISDWDDHASSERAFFVHLRIGQKHELHGWYSAFALGKLTTSGAVHANKIACSEDVVSSLRQYTKEVHFTRICL